MITMLEKNIHIKNTRKQDTIEYAERDHAENTLKPWSLSSKKYKEIIEKKKTATTNSAVAQADSEARKAQAKEKNAAATAICEKAEAKTEEVEIMCKGNIMSDSVVTANENDGWHRGCASLSAANEDEEHMEFNNDHVKLDMHEDTKKCELSRCGR